MSENAATVAALLAYVQADGRVCPQPQQWIKLYDMLPGKRRTGGSSDPAPPLILAAWYNTPHLLKTLRLVEHIEYAAEHGVLDAVDAFLHNLPADGWHYTSEK